ncbi:unnamed protein product [Penicillium roqueforti FM164]|uniref:Genomic scaffold, ProqFM164S02 n=1 Tax=Penicillium roqueforti (strain FM164) TaxID=1365484 RepID=W6QCA0_PENRF|nr:unnamed protein product [Penicillium roqueforti FM164]
MPSKTGIDSWGMRGDRHAACVQRYCSIAFVAIRMANVGLNFMIDDRQAQAKIR